MILLDVPYSEKDHVKSLGAKWLPEQKNGQQYHDLITINSFHGYVALIYLKVRVKGAWILPVTMYSSRKGINIVLNVERKQE